MKSLYDVIRRPLITEKANLDKEKLNAYHFEVDFEAGSQEIKESVEKVFKVKVKKVRTMIVHGKKRRLGRSQGQRPNWKKAIVTLSKGQRIDIFEGM